MAEPPTGVSRTLQPVPVGNQPSDGGVNTFVPHAYSGDGLDEVRMLDAVLPLGRSSATQYAAKNAPESPCVSIESVA